MDEELITEEVLEEAGIAFTSAFKPETRFEKQIVFATHTGSGEFLSRVPHSRIVKRTPDSILAEILLCKKLGWDVRVKTNTNLYAFDEIVDIVRNMSAAYGRKFWVNVGPVTRTEIELLTPFVEGVSASIGSVNKDVQRKIIPHIPLAAYLTMFSDARKIQKGISITLGMGEKLEDTKELFRFIDTHQIDRVLFKPFAPVRSTPYAKEPSSFYCARWIAETRIRFPHVTVVAGTTEERVAETGLYLKAGANTITNFPIIRLFNSEQARSIEEEARNAGRTFIGTLTDTNKLDTENAAQIGSNIKEKLDRYITALKRSQHSS